MRLFIFQTAVKTGLLLLWLLFTVCFDSWMDTRHQCSRAKELSFNPSIGETSQLFFLACRPAS